MKLNSDQENAVNKLYKFFADPSKRVIVIVGPGGSGKSHSVVKFISDNFDKVQPVAMTAPTNKAVGVLVGFSKAIGRCLPSITIYKLLGLVVGADGEEKHTFAANDGTFDNYKTIVIDEGSMAPRVLCRHLENRLFENPNAKIIVMMDRCQLPPINENETSIINMGEVVYLTQDMRSGNGPLLRVKRAVRDIVEARLDGNMSLQLSYDFETDLEEDGSGVHFLPGKAFDDAMLDMFDTEEYKVDPNFVRAIAWTNKEVDRMNRIIRQRLYGKGCDAFVVGERICCLNPYADPATGEPLYGTDDEVDIVSLEIVDYVDYTDQDATDDARRTYKAFRAQLKDQEGKTSFAHILHPDSSRKFNRRAEFLADQAKAKKRPWKNFWDFKEGIFLSARPAHAMTVHKSQGQTFGCTFMNLKDAMNNKRTLERAQLIYTGVSRASTDLVVNVRRFY